MTNTIQITRTMKFAAVVDFATVAKATNEGMHNISSREDGKVEQFLRENDLHETPRIFLATHSMGGRGWELAEGCVAPFYEDFDLDGGWDVLTDENCTFLSLSSMSSGSTISAEKRTDGSWELVLEVPVEEDGTPYKGYYYSSFMAALGQPEVEEAA